MKTRYRFIRFEEAEWGEVPPNAKPHWYIRNNRDHGNMGRVEYNERWRQWEVAFEPSYAWTHDCLADVREFILALNATLDRKEEARNG